MLKKSLTAFLLLGLSACGPGQQPPPPAAEPTPPPATEAPVPAPAPAAQASPDDQRREAERHAERERERQQREQEREQAQVPPLPVCGDCGVIAAIDQERVAGDPTAIGTIGGAAAGGAAGGQFGKKSGKIAMIALGAIGGALAGREVESQVRATTVFHVTVNMAAGGSQVVTVNDLNGLGVGSRVHLNAGGLQYAQ